AHTSSPLPTARRRQTPVGWSRCLAYSPLARWSQLQGRKGVRVRFHYGVAAPAKKRPHSDAGPPPVYRAPIFMRAGDGYRHEGFVSSRLFVSSHLVSSRFVSSRLGVRPTPRDETRRNETESNLRLRPVIFTGPSCNPSDASSRRGVARALARRVAPATSRVRLGPPVPDTSVPPAAGLS